jgi:hypothetical protein
MKEVYQTEFAKEYAFANVSAACCLDVKEFHSGNQVIYLQHGKPIESMSFYRERNTIARHVPLKENGNMEFGNFIHAVRCLLSWDKKGKRSIVISAIGNHNNQVVIEAFHYAKMGSHLTDRCKGYQNHLIYCSMYGYLPSLPHIEQELKRLGDEFHKDVLHHISGLNNQHITNSQ